MERKITKKRIYGTQSKTLLSLDNDSIVSNEFAVNKTSYCKDGPKMLSFVGIVNGNRKLQQDDFSCLKYWKHTVGRFIE